MINKLEILDFIQQLRNNEVVYPPQDQILRAFTYFKPSETKIIIIGMDPYHTAGDACGLAFSVEHDKHPPSLKNIFKELKNDLGFESPKLGSLEEWAKQGVLLLNAALTVKESSPGSHMSLWEKFTKRAIQMVLEQNRPLVIIAWGRNAQEVLTNLPKHNKCLVLTGSHPSPLSAYKGFFGGKYFSRSNEWLLKHNIEPIEWNLAAVEIDKLMLEE